MISDPILEDLLKRWGRDVEYRQGAWHTECPSFKIYTDRTTRAPIFCDSSDDVEKLGRHIGKMVWTLRVALKLRWAKRYTFTKAAKSMRIETVEYRRYLNEAERRLSDIYKKDAA